MDTIQIVMLVILFLLILMYPVMMIRRNKKEQENQQNLVSSLTKDDYVLTYSGIFGKIVEIVEKEVGKFVIIETGEKNKSYITVSENAIYTKVNNNPKIYDVDGNVIEKTEAPVEKNEDSTQETQEKTETTKKRTRKKAE